MERQSTKVFITGGHLTPALATVEEIEREKLTWEVVFIGRKYAMEGERTLSQEYRIVGKHQIRFIPIAAGRLQRSLTGYTLVSLFKFPLGLLQALWYCGVEKPDLILSFGGYVALPVVLGGWLLGIPSVTHEQTQAPGLANRIIGRLARRICVSFDQTSASFPGQKTVVTGLPLRRGLLQPPAKPAFSLDARLPLLFITGGVTGAQSLNEAVYPAVAGLVSRYNIIHQTGTKSFVRATAVRNQLPQKLKARYQIFPFLESAQMSWALHHAQLLLCRSGANTVGEVAALGKVAIFVPLPWAAGQEQYHNAQWLVRTGAAVILAQQNLNPTTLEAEIKRVTAHIDEYQKNSKQVSSTIRLDGAVRLLDEIKTVLNQTQRSG